MAIPLRFRDLQIPAEPGKHDHPGDHVLVQVAPEIAEELTHKGLGTMVYLHKASDAWEILLAPKQREASSRPKRQEAIASSETPAPLEDVPTASEEPQAETPSEPDNEPDIAA